MPEQERKYGWNLGAAVGFTASSFESAFTPGGLGPLSVRTPSYRLSIERRLASTTWLFLGGAFAYGTFDASLISTTGDPLERTHVELTNTSFGALLGVRQVLVEGIVEVSVFAALAAGYTAIGGERLNPGEQQLSAPEAGSTGTAYGVLGGIAVERELIDALALRLSTELVSADISTVETVERSTGAETTTELSRHSFDVGLAPAIEVRFYF